MLERINKEIITARKARDKFKTKVYSSLKAELINNSKVKKPIKEQQVIQTYAKKLEKAAHAFAKTDRYEELKEEVKIVQELLPKMMAPELVLAKVKNYFEDMVGPYNKGIAIKELKAELGAENGRYIVQYVNSMLG